MPETSELEYLKRCYEEKAEQLYQMERKLAHMKREKELAENYCDRLLQFISEQLPDTNSIPTFQ